MSNEQNKQNIYKNSENDINTLKQSLKQLLNDMVLMKNMPESFGESLKAWCSIINKRCSEPFTLVVLGDFKRGKSTIINAILGKELAPVNAAPETYTINEISYGDKLSVTANLKNGQTVELQQKDLTRERIEELIEDLPAPIEYIDIKDTAPILKELRIVDTPGLSDLDDLDKQVTEYLVNADAIIYVASALLPISESEQLFLSTHIQPQRFGMLYILVNMIDALNSQKDIDKILNRVSSISDSLVPNTIIYGISGADEFKRKTGLDRPLDKGTREFYETQFFKFELSLKRDIIMQKDIIRSKRVLNMLNCAVSDVAAQIRMYMDVSSYDKAKLEAISSDFENQCRTIENALADAEPKLTLSMTEMSQEAQSWMYDFFAKLRENVLDCRPKVAEEEMKSVQGFSPDDVEKHFYSYLMEKVGEAYRTCIETHRKKMDELVGAVSRKIAAQLGIDELAEVSQAAAVDSIMNKFKKTVTRTVMDAALFGSNENFPNATMSDFKKMMKRKRKTDIIDTALENFDDIRTNALKDLKAAYQVLENTAFDRLEGIFKAQVEAGRQAIELAQGMNVQGDSEILSNSMKNSTALLEKMEAVLEKYGLEQM